METGGGKETVGWLRSWGHPEVQLSLVNQENMEFLGSKEDPKIFDSISFVVDSFFMVYSDGSFAHFRHTPRQLYNRLKGRQQSDQVRPEMVRLVKRTEGICFIQASMSGQR